MRWRSRIGHGRTDTSSAPGAWMVSSSRCFRSPGERVGATACTVPAARNPPGGRVPEAAGGSDLLAHLAELRHLALQLVDGPAVALLDRLGHRPGLEQPH